MAEFLSSVTPGSSKASGTKFFATDIPYPGNRTAVVDLTLHFSLSSPVVLYYTLDGGTNWYALNNGNAYPSGCGQLVSIPLKTGGLFNLKQLSGANVTVDLCEVMTA